MLVVLNLQCKAFFLEHYDIFTGIWRNYSCKISNPHISELEHLGQKERNLWSFFKMHRFPFFSILEEKISVGWAESSMYGIFFDTLRYFYRNLQKLQLQNFEPSYFGMRALLGQKELNLWSLLKLPRYPFFSILEEKVSVGGAESSMYGIFFVTWCNFYR